MSPHPIQLLHLEIILSRTHSRAIRLLYQNDKLVKLKGNPARRKRRLLPCNHVPFHTNLFDMNSTDEPSKNREQITAPLHTARSLFLAGRTPPLPFSVKLANGQTATMTRLLRVLPGKRITGQGILEKTTVLVKLFIGSGSARHSRREFAGITALHKAKLPTPRLITSSPIAGNGHAIITEFLSPSETLESPNDFILQDAPRLIPVFQLLGRLHAAGLQHNDLHLGNFLHHNGNVFMIDGDTIRPTPREKPLMGRKALLNLATLLANQPKEQAPLIEAYRRGNPTCDVPQDLIQKMVQKKCARETNRFLRKSVRDCTQFTVARTTHRYSCVLRTQKEELAVLLADPDTATETGHRLKDGDSSTVSRIDLPDRSVVIKRYNLPTQRYAFSRLWRPSRAWNSWKEGLRLQRLGIQTPHPLALIEKRFGPLRRTAWIINEFCPGIPLLDTLNPDQAPSPEEASAILHLFNTLHDEQVSHGDFKATNLLWQAGQLSVIDLDAMKRHRFQWTHRRAWKKDRARFLRNWPKDVPLYQWLDTHLPK